jgi:hypothetical protein
VCALWYGLWIVDFWGHGADGLGMYWHVDDDIWVRGGDLAYKGWQVVLMQCLNSTLISVSGLFLITYWCSCLYISTHSSIRRIARQYGCPPTV